MASASIAVEGGLGKILILPASEMARPAYLSGVSYRVFARKYRPQTFGEVVDQEHVTRTLQNAISAGRVAQAYLFVGPRGIGKTSTARILAKALNCAEGPTVTPCGKCDACREIAEGRSLDVLEIDGASNNGVENIRELRENTAYAPACGPYKIYIIDEVHMLSAGAFNALLKTLEEPPAHVKFIFATTEAQKVPATITSRCQRFDLRRISAEAIARHLLLIAEKENIVLEPRAAAAIGRGAEGALRDAESMLDQCVAFCGEKISEQNVMSVFGFASREVTAALLERILKRDASAGLKIVAEQTEAGRDLSRLLGDLVGQVRDLLVANAEDEAVAPRDKLLLLLDHFAETESRMRWASDKKLQLDVAVIKAAHLLGQASLDEVIEILAALRGGAVPPRTEQPQTRATISKPDPEPEPCARRAPKAEAVDIAVAWDRVASSYESSLKFRWLTKAIFLEAAGDNVLVQIPFSFADEFRSVVGESGRRDAESKLSGLLAQRISLRFQVAEQPPESPATEDGSQAARLPEERPAAEPAEAKSKDPVEEFKNDPLIKKALEIFAGEIQTSSK
jgi:DNA polymerase-3 subunit gamma/tau